MLQCVKVLNIYRCEQNDIVLLLADQSVAHPSMCAKQYCFLTCGPMCGPSVIVSNTVLFFQLQVNVRHIRHCKQYSIVFFYSRAIVRHILHCEQNSIVFLLAGRCVAHSSLQAKQYCFLTCWPDLLHIRHCEQNSVILVFGCQSVAHLSV